MQNATKIAVFISLQFCSEAACCVCETPETVLTALTTTTERRGGIVVDGVE